MILNENARATFILCSHLSVKNTETKPYASVEWSTLVEKILNSDLKEPANLFGLSQNELEAKLGLTSSEALRIIKLISRGADLAFQLEELERKSIGVITRGDKEYPIRIKKALGRKAPPIIYYCGNLSLINKAGVSIVGSRNVDTDGADIAKKIASMASYEGVAIYSGGAKGVDQIAERTAFSTGGCCISFIADSMIRKIKDYTKEISSGRMLILSAVNPNAPFSAPNAMNRNKYIYILSNLSFVIASDYNKGGTWAGALENIKNNWVNSYVWENDKYAGNIPLIQRGAFGFSNLDGITISQLMTNPIKQKQSLEQLNIFSVQQPDENIKKQVHDKEMIVDTIINKTSYEEISQSKTLFSAVLPIILKCLVTPKNIDEISSELEILKKQTAIWIDEGISLGLIVKTRNPVKYTIK